MFLCLLPWLVGCYLDRLVVCLLLFVVVTDNKCYVVCWLVACLFAGLFSFVCYLDCCGFLVCCCNINSDSVALFCYFCT